MPLFPSLDWFEALRDVVNADPAFRQSGMVDLVMGVDVGGTAFKVVFDTWEVAEVAVLDDLDSDDIDFTLRMPADNWRDLIQNIHEHGKADRRHTLNSLDLQSEDNVAQGDDYHRRDKFYRFNQSIQDFFDASARIDSTFA
jgi:hypothetical protein